MSVKTSNGIGVSPGLIRQSTEVKVGEGRRRFSESYKEKILEELDHAGHGEKGLIMRRENLYANTVNKWRRQRTGSELSVQAKKKVGSDEELRKQVQRLEREKQQLQRKLVEAEKIIEIQKKVSELLGVLTTNEGSTP